MLMDSSRNQIAEKKINNFISTPDREGDIDFKSRRSMSPIEQKLGRDQGIQIVIQKSEEYKDIIVTENTPQNLKLGSIKS